MNLRPVNGDPDYAQNKTCENWLLSTGTRCCAINSINKATIFINTLALEVLDAKYCCTTSIFYQRSCSYTPRDGGVPTDSVTPCSCNLLHCKFDSPAADWYSLAASAQSKFQHERNNYTWTYFNGNIAHGSGEQTSIVIFPQVLCDNYHKLFQRDSWYCMVFKLLPIPILTAVISRYKQCMCYTSILTIAVSVIKYKKCMSVILPS